MDVEYNQQLVLTLWKIQECSPITTYDKSVLTDIQRMLASEVHSSIIQSRFNLITNTHIRNLFSQIDNIRYDELILVITYGVVKFAHRGKISSYGASRRTQNYNGLIFERDKPRSASRTNEQFSKSVALNHDSFQFQQQKLNLLRKKQFVQRQIKNFESQEHTAINQSQKCEIYDQVLNKSKLEAVAVQFDELRKSVKVQNSAQPQLSEQNISAGQIESVVTVSQLEQIDENSEQASCLSDPIEVDLQQTDKPIVQNEQLLQKLTSTAQCYLEYDPVVKQRLSILMPSPPCPQSNQSNFKRHHLYHRKLEISQFSPILDKQLAINQNEVIQKSPCQQVNIAQYQLQLKHNILDALRTQHTILKQQQTEINKLAYDQLLAGQGYHSLRQMLHIQSQKPRIDCDHSRACCELKRCELLKTQNVLQTEHQILLNQFAYLVRNLNLQLETQKALLQSEHFEKSTPIESALLTNRTAFSQRLQQLQQLQQRRQELAASATNKQQFSALLVQDDLELQRRRLALLQQMSGLHAFTHPYIANLRTSLRSLSLKRDALKQKADQLNLGKKAIEASLFDILEALLQKIAEIDALV